MDAIVKKIESELCRLRGVETDSDYGTEEESEDREPCIVCGDESSDWLPVYAGGKWYDRKGTAYHCGCHTDEEIIRAYAKARDDEAQALGYADAADMDNPEGDEL